MNAKLRAVMFAILLGNTSGAIAGELPKEIVAQLLPGYVVLSSARSSFGVPMHIFYFVVLGSQKEAMAPRKLTGAAARPLLIYQQNSHGGYVLFGRNDEVVLRADEGLQCDPFTDGRGVAVKGRYFTVENEVSCGQHWTDYVTFRFDERSGGYVFDNERAQSWHMNPSNDLNAEALVPDPQEVIRPNEGQSISFVQWRRAAH